MDSITSSPCPEIYVGLHGVGRGHIKDCVDEMIAERSLRRALPELQVTYFDSRSVNPWGLKIS